jgi:hypothetical protein
MGVSLSLQRAGNRFHEAVEREGIRPIAACPIRRMRPRAAMIS